MFDRDSDGPSVVDDLEDSEERFAAEAEEAEQGNVWVEGVPEPSGGWEVRDFGEGGEDRA